MLEHLLVLKGVDAPGGTARLADELLERVNLTQGAKRKVKEYSGGMRQRLGIAQALAGNPRLLIVDEPTAGLDPEERVRFYHLLAELAQERIVLLSTHIVEDVAVLCSRFAVIRDGRLVARTTPAQARSEIEGRIFEGEVERAALPELRRATTVLQTMPAGPRLRVRIHERGTAPEGFVGARPTLEDAYLSWMKNGAAHLAGASA